MHNTGIHHISVLSRSARQAYHFYKEVLGLKLTLKTVNQDDVAMYHLFFGDQTGRQGTEFTVFEMKGSPKNQFGTNALERTNFLVQSLEALKFWEARLEEKAVLHYGIETFNGRQILRFEDGDGQKLGLEYRDKLDWSTMQPHHQEDIPEFAAIAGIASLDMRVRYPEATEKLLVGKFGFEKVGETIFYDRKVYIYAFKNGAFPHEIHVIEDRTSPIQRLGVGGIHHLAFGVERVSDLEELMQDLEDRNQFNSGIINRDFMVSAYFREPNYNLFEVATPIDPNKIIAQDATSFDDVPLYLPDFLADRRDQIQGYLE